MLEERINFEVIREKMKRTDYVHRYVPNGTLYFYDPDNDDIVYRGYDDAPWGTADGYSFAFKLDDWELYDSMSPAEAMELIEERIRGQEHQ